MLFDPLLESKSMSIPDFVPVEGSKLTQELSCSICLSVLNNPVELVDCGHMYCYACLFGQEPLADARRGRSSTMPVGTSCGMPSLLSTSPKPKLTACPQCRAPLGKVKEPHRALRNLLESLEGSCSVCRWSGQYAHFRHHAPCFQKQACSAVPPPPAAVSLPPQPSFGSFPVLQQPSQYSSGFYPPPPMAPPSNATPSPSTDSAFGVSTSGFYRNPFSTNNLVKNQHAR